jgi:hypothetical protein
MIGGYTASVLAEMRRETDTYRRDLGRCEDARDALLVELARAIAIIGRSVVALQPASAKVQVDLSTSLERLEQLSDALSRRGEVGFGPKD